MRMSPVEVGRAVFRLSKGFWGGRTRSLSIVLTVGAFGFTLVDVGMQVLLNRWTKQFYDAIEKRGLDLIWQAALLFAALSVAATASIVIGSYMRQMLQVYWRRHLSEKLLDRWLTNQAYYRLNVMRGAEFAPEARVAEDARLTVEPIVDLLTGFLNAVVTFVAFVGILWTIGGSLSVGGVTIPGFMVWGAIAYAAGVSILMILVGRTYAQRVRDRSDAEAQFRYELTRLRENAESVALVRGEDGERKALLGRLSGIVQAWRNMNVTWGYMTVVSYASGLAAPIVPVLLMAPKYLSDSTMTFGTVMQAAAAFGSVQGALAWLTSNFSRLSEWYAAASRVTELSLYIDAAAAPDEAKNRIDVKSIDGTTLELKDVSVRLHTGRVLISNANFSIEPGDMVLVSGKSGTGKSMLIRAIAGLWPWGSGAILKPEKAHIEFVPQRPYLPLGTLKAALTYPDAVSAHSDEEVVKALRLCDLEHLVPRLHDQAGWDRILSGGEQQRVSFARLLIRKPDFVMLDEATSALDDANQDRLMNLFATELAHTSVISIAHRTSLARYHSRHIDIRKEASGARAVAQILRLTDWFRARIKARRARKIGAGPLSRRRDDPSSSAGVEMKSGVSSKAPETPPSGPADPRRD